MTPQPITVPTLPMSRTARGVPQRLPIPWHPKRASDARSGVQQLADGRLHAWIEHEVIRGVTPEMLLWWFQHLEGPMELHGVRAERYRFWHPVDHVQVRYARLCRDGSVGPGAVLHLTECLAACPEYRVDVRSLIVKLDLEGFGHRPRVHGLSLAAMDYRWQAVPGGTRYVNSLTIGLPGRWARPLNRLIQRFVFNEARARAWIRHNVEEVGQFENFLPQLWAHEAH